MPASEISDDTFEQDVLASEEPVLVDFFTTWCSPCKAMVPALDAVADELRGKVKVVKIDIGANPATAANCAVRGVPTLIVFKDGKPVARHVGALTRKELLLRWVNDCASPETGIDERQASTFKLANGMEVVVLPDRRAPLVTHMVCYKFGAADAPEGRSGLPHLVERLTANSVRNSGIAGASSHFPDYSLNPGGHDATIFQRRIAREELSNAMAVEVERMLHLHLSDEDVAAACRVVDDHLAQVEATAPAIVRHHGRMSAEMTSALFGAHPYGVPGIGRPDERKNLSREDALRFHERHYVPNNAVLVVAGKITLDEVRQLAEATYGMVPTKALVPRRGPGMEPPSTPARRIVVTDKQASGQYFRRMYLTPSHATAQPGEAEALELLAFIVAGAKDSRLNRNLLQEAGPVSAATAYYRTDAVDFGVLSLQVATRGADTEIEGSVTRVIDDLRRNGVTDAELDRAKQGVLANFAARSDIQEELASRYAWALVLGRTVADVDGWPEAIAKVTAADVQRVAQEYLDPRRSVTGWLLSKIAEGSST